VLVEGRYILGDGVNVAARVQALAEGGGIAVSGTVYDQVENKLALTYESLGEHAVKSIAKPVRVDRVAMGAGTAAGLGETKEVRSRPRLRAVLIGLTVLIAARISGGRRFLRDSRAVARRRESSFRCSIPSPPGSTS
jgi:adenylate cyclase